jgi:hypothetical protein
MRRLFPLIPLLLTTTLVAQEPAPPAAPAAPAARFQALEAEAEALVTAWRQQMREQAEKAKADPAKADPAKPAAAMPMRPDFAPLVAKAEQAAADYRGTDAAVPFLVWIAQNSAGADRAAVARALETLTTAHIDHADLAKLGPMIGFLPRILDAETATGIQGRLLASKNPDVRGHALLAKHTETIEKGDRDGDAYRNAKLDLLQAADQATNPMLKQEIRSAIDLREKFGVGIVAPDIEGSDLDGVAFKLSDYRGKVIFLDFWGDW